MGTNTILRFGSTDTTTNLLTEAEYSADAQRLIGNQPGIARAKLVNKALRNLSALCAGIAQFIADRGPNVDDSADATTMANNFLTALRSGAVFPTPAVGDNSNNVGTTAFVQQAMLGGTAQSWQDVSGSRTVNTLYLNSTGRPIFVKVGGSVTGAVGYYVLYINSLTGIKVSETNVPAGNRFFVCAVVPAGAQYGVGKGGADTLSVIDWAELR
jgi:hypothetical protein